MGIPSKNLILTLFALFFLSLTNVHAQITPFPMPGKAPETPAAAAPPASAQPPAQPPAPVPQIDKVEVSKRANDDMGQDIAATQKAWRTELDDISKALRPEANPKYAELNAVRERLERLRGQFQDFGNRLRPKLDGMKTQVEQLGAPAAGAPPETEEGARFRAEVNYHYGVFVDAQREVTAGIRRTEDQINVVQDRRRRNFTTMLFAPVPGIYLSTTWMNAPANIKTTSTRIVELLWMWWSGLEDQMDVLRLVAQAGALWFVLGLLAWRGTSRMRAWPHPEEPPFWKRASSAAGVILLRALPAVLPIIYLYHAVTSSHEVPERIDWLFYTAARSAIIIFAVHALVNTVFAPYASHWRLVPASNAAARRICGLVFGLAVVYGVSTLIYTATRLVQAPFSLTIVQSLPASLIEALLVIAILRTPLNGKTGEDLPSLTWLRLLRLPIWLIAFFIVASALTGYLALSRFAAQQLIVTGSILAVVYLLLLWVDGFTQGFSDESALTGGWLKSVGLDERRREQVAVPSGLLLKFGVLVLSVPLIMLQWGYPWGDILYWYRQLIFELQIGNTQISVAVLVASILVFVLGYLGARLFQSWLDAQILKPAGLSGGFARLDSHRCRLYRRDRGGIGGVLLCRVEPVQSRHRCRCPVGRYRFRLAKRGQQLRVRADPARGTSDQGGGSRRCQRRGRLCPQDQRALDRNRDLRPGQRAHSELGVYHRQGQELDTSQQHGPRFRIGGCRLRLRRAKG